RPAAVLHHAGTAVLSVPGDRNSGGNRRPHRKGQHRPGDRHHRAAGVKLCLRILAPLLVSAWLVTVPGTPKARATPPGKNGLIALDSNRRGNFDIFTIKPDGTGIV